jgi:hypothetical protein
MRAADECGDVKRIEKNRRNWRRDCNSKKRSGDANVFPSRRSLWKRHNRMQLQIENFPLQIAS